MKKFSWLLLGLSILLVLSACGAGSGVQSTGANTNGEENNADITIGYFPNLDHAAGIVGKNKGFFDDEMTNANVSFTNFPNGNDFIAALDSGNIQLGYVGPGPAINYFLKGGDIVILSAAANGATLIVAREGSGIESLEDFDGKSFGTPGNGCTHNVQLEIMLKELGLESNRVGGTVVHQSRVAPANMMVQFEQGTIDAAAAPEPWGTYLVEELGAKVITEWNDVFLGETLPSVVFVTTTKFAEENPELVREAVQAHAKSVEYANNNVEDTLNTVNDQIFELTQKRLPEAVLEKAWNRMLVTTKTFPDALQSWADASYELQFITEKPNLDGFVDSSIIDEITGQ